MKKFIDYLMEKYWFRLHYSSIKLFTQDDVQKIITQACEAQRKACVRIYKELGLLCEYDDIETAQITEKDYD